MCHVEEEAPYLDSDFKEIYCKASDRDDASEDAALLHNPATQESQRRQIAIGRMFWLAHISMLCLNLFIASFLIGPWMGSDSKALASYHFEYDYGE